MLDYLNYKLPQGFKIILKNKLLYYKNINYLFIPLLNLFHIERF